MLKRLILTIIILGWADIYSQNQFEVRLNHVNHGKNFLLDSRPYFKKTTVADSSLECNIILTDGSSLNKVKFLNSNDSSFTITKNGVNNDFSISRIHTITFQKHNFGTGVLIGVITSVAFWGALGLANGTPESIKWGLMLGAVFAIPTGLIAGLIAEFTSGEDVYRFGTINSDVKGNRLKAIRLKHNFN
jgi:hypothetical protein